MRVRLVLLLVALCALGVPAGAEARTVWLCRPGLDDNPCTRSLNATVLARDGTPGRAERTSIPRRPPIDCFFVYPTVSGQSTVTANRQIEDPQRSAASFQANRFSEVCRVFAPVYRQFTLLALADPDSLTPSVLRRGYVDVRAAWRDYLENHNQGRGVVLLGHSQGTFVLRDLLDDVIEERRGQRRRLVSALLLGGNITVARGEDADGDFEDVRACRSRSQLRCVVAYSTYNETPPPAGAVFGRTTDADLEVLCTNPASLGGGSGRLDTYVRTEPFAGLLGPPVAMQTGALPDVATPWLHLSGHYSARCSRAGGAHLLHVDEIGAARRLIPQPDTFGLHLADVNIALGNLTQLVRRQSRAYRR